MSLRRPSWTGLALIVLVLGHIGYQSVASRGGIFRPTISVTVNLEEMFAGLNIMREADAALTLLAEQLNADGDIMADEIQGLEEQLEVYAAGSDKHQEVLEQYQLKSLEFQALMEFSRRKIDVEKSLTLRHVYADIKVAAADLAGERGYDVVFVDDTINELTPGSETEVRRQIASRRMLYTNAEIDVTAELIAWLNR